MFKLVIQDDEGKTTVVPLIRDEITIGRKEGNTIRLTERNVSRRHARILRNNGEVHIEDLGSYNGIRVNNARIAERVSLRVSDQVQIGDYKLYLKAEGVEQVDDARTMPIERVDTANTATDVIPAITQPMQSAPTTPMAIQTPAPGTLPPAAQLIGNPNRTLVAVADTDPQGRPVASAAQVAAVLSSPAGYGKLVVLSSNFAGKEFELSRPQMIIGRTDENDIVVNHRSISRNHAKLVRETDTGRYTISDLQSSNGVRVNGQDYGKVELRRGDVVDLGHVRLRFVESGEDFVFSRDAVITDVPDTASRKGLWLAIGAALLVVVAGVLFMVLNKKDGDKTNKGGSNDVVAGADAGSQIAVTPSDAAEVETSNDATSTVAPTTDVEILHAQCLAARDAKRWAELISCGERLGKVDKAAGQKFYDNGHTELTAEATARKFKIAMDEGSLRKAKVELDKIDKDSVYRIDADARYKRDEEAKQNELENKLRGYAKQNKPDCVSWNKLLVQMKETLPDDVISDARRAEPCTTVAIKDPVTPPKENPCDKYDDIINRGQDALSGNNDALAASLFDQAYRCRATNDVLRKIMLVTCRQKNLPKAQKLYKNADSGTKTWMVGICSNKGLYQKDLEGN
ncbi:MAG: FHA domain-containing protein [Myxococcota bacterium]|nr:FHA domain-containing protein [Deltaproteobacteria bacterium]MDQ3335956.1 FHA domain-containing protein [Myxococcota bacterium]